MQEPENAAVHGKSGIAEDFGEYGDDEEEEEDDDDDQSDSEFKASIWDKNATPTKGLLKSADKRLSSVSSRNTNLKRFFYVNVIKILKVRLFVTGGEENGFVQVSKEIRDLRVSEGGSRRGGGGVLRGPQSLPVELSHVRSADGLLELCR